MLTGEIRSQIDSIWNDFWSGGVSNPLSVIEQITYLLFIIFLNTGISIADSAGSDHYSLKHIDLTEADNGSAIGVVVGTDLNVFLKVPPKILDKRSCYWSEATISGGGALQKITKVVLLPNGVTATFFLAIQPGLVGLNSFRQSCSNGGVIEWHINICVSY
jgi:HsdM N-terminal domain